MWTVLGSFGRKEGRGWTVGRSAEGGGGQGRGEVATHQHTDCEVH